MAEAKKDPFYSAQDKRLSVAARGMMFYLIAQRPDWQMTYEGLQREFGLGRKAIRTITGELIKCGYLEGKITVGQGYVWTWYPQPKTRETA